MTHICVGKLTIGGSDNGLAPGRHQAIIWTNAWILLIWHLGTSFNEILIEIYTFSFKKTHFKMSSGKWRPFCLGFNVLSHGSYYEIECHCGFHSLLLDINCMAMIDIYFPLYKERNHKKENISRNTIQRVLTHKQYSCIKHWTLNKNKNIQKKIIMRGTRTCDPFQ